MTNVRRVWALGAATALMLSALGVLAAQDKKPAKKTAPQAAKSQAHILLNVWTKGGVYKIERLDLADDKSKDLLSDSQEKVGYTLLEVSPNGKTGIVMVSALRRRRPVLYDLTTAKPLKTAIPKVRASFCFVDDDNLIDIEQLSSQQDGDPKMRVVQSNLKGSVRNVLLQSEESFWDDVPLTLTPDKKQLLYFAVDKDGNKKGLVMLSLKDGSLQSLPAGITFCKWSKDGKRIFGFSKKQGFLRYDYDGKGQFSNEKLIAQPIIFLRTLADDSYLGLKINKADDKIHLAVMDKDAKIKLELTGKAKKGTETVRQPAAYDASTQSYYYIEYERQQGLRLFRLMAAKVKDGKVVSRRVVKASEEALSMPFLVRH